MVWEVTTGTKGTAEETLTHPGCLAARVFGTTDESRVDEMDGRRTLSHSSLRSGAFYNSEVDGDGVGPTTS